MHRNDLINGGFQACTPNDNTAVNYVGLIAGASGTVTVVDSYGVTTAIPVQAGTVITGRIVKVMSTGTTGATPLVGFVP